MIDSIKLNLENNFLRYLFLIRYYKFNLLAGETSTPTFVENKMCDIGI